MLPSSPWLDAGLAALIGLLIGSFLNVVIYRLPRMMHRAWLREALDSLRDDAEAPAEQSPWKSVFGPAAALPRNLAAGAQQAFGQVEALPPLSLSRPGSSCRSCGHALRWFENIPLLSYALQRGQCRGCGAPYGLRYPLVELLAGLLFFYCGWRWGLTLTGALWAAFCAALLALLFIDWDSTLLPDGIVLPLLWLGLLAASLGWIDTRLPDALWGAAAGYLSLWSICALFKLATGRQGMGHGDFKLLAALGAWLGWQALLPVVLLSSVIGALAGIALKLGGRLGPHGYFPFGPFLVGAAWVVLALGVDVVAHAILMR